MAGFSFSEFYEVRRKFIIKTVVWSAVAWVLATMAAGNFAQHYRIGLDLDKVKCLPWTAYFIEIGRYPAVKGEYVAFVANNDLMGQKFNGKLIGKMVLAVAGDKITIKHDVLYVNDAKIDVLHLIQRLRAKPGQFDTEYIIPKGKFFAYGTEPRSYDSRYWGLVSEDIISGKASPLF